MKKHGMMLIIIILYFILCTSCIDEQGLFFEDKKDDKTVMQDERVLKILSIWPEDSDNGKLIIEITEQYIKEVNNDFDYEYELVSVENLDQKIAVLVASDDLPDVFVYDSGEPLKRLIKSNVLLDIGQALKDMEAEHFLDDSAVKLLKSLSDSTAMYDLPLGLNVEGFWYNKALFEKVGVSVPETWDEMLEVCEKLKAAGIQPISAGGSDKWPLTRLVNAYAYRSMGVDVMDKAANGEIFYTDPGLVAAANMIRDMADKGYLGSNITTVDQNTAGELLLTGMAAMFYNGSWFTQDLVSESNPAGDDGIGFFSVPIVDANISSKTEYPMNCGNILAMDKDKYDEQTADWLYFFVSHIGDLAMEEFGAVKGYQYEKQGELHPYSQIVANALSEVSASTKWFEAEMDSNTKMAAHDGVQALVNGDITGSEYMEQIQTNYNSGKK